MLPKVTKMGSIIGYRIGHNGVGVPRGHIYIYIDYVDYSLSLRYSVRCFRRAWYVWNLDKSVRHNFLWLWVLRLRDHQNDLSDDRVSVKLRVAEKLCLIDLSNFQIYMYICIYIYIYVIYIYIYIISRISFFSFSFYSRFSSNISQSPERCLCFWNSL